MDFLDELLKKLFPKRHKSVPLVREPIERSVIYEQELNIWQSGYEAKKWNREIQLSYQQKKNGNTSSVIDVHLFRSPASNGIAITYPKNEMSKKNFGFLFDSLKERILSLSYPYQHYTSDRSHYERATYVETIEKHYLKPSQKDELKNSDVPTFQSLPQYYGNILIEYIQIDGEPSFIRLMAHIYSDSLYQKAIPFDDLMDELFS